MKFEQELMIEKEIKGNTIIYLPKDIFETFNDEHGFRFYFQVAGNIINHYWIQEGTQLIFVFQEIKSIEKIKTKPVLKKHQIEPFYTNEFLDFLKLKISEDGIRNLYQFIHVWLKFVEQARNDGIRLFNLEELNYLKIRVSHIPKKQVETFLNEYVIERNTKRMDLLDSISKEMMVNEDYKNAGSTEKRGMVIGVFARKRHGINLTYAERRAINSSMYRHNRKLTALMQKMSKKLRLEKIQGKRDVKE